MSIDAAFNDATTYTRKPFQVRAIRVTEENLEELSETFGPIKYDVTGQAYIQVVRRLARRGWKLYPGSYVTQMDVKVRFYTAPVFENQFTETTRRIKRFSDHIPDEVEPITMPGYSLPKPSGPTSEDVLPYWSNTPVPSGYISLIVPKIELETFMNDMIGYLERSTAGLNILSIQDTIYAYQLEDGRLQVWSEDDAKDQEDISVNPLFGSVGRREPKDHSKHAHVPFAPGKALPPTVSDLADEQE